MKQFAAWAIVAIAAFAALAAGYHYHLESEPRRVVVVVDSSQPMSGALRRVDAVLDELATRRYHEFALFTDRARVHGWASRFSPGKINPYGPRALENLTKLEGQPEIVEADEVVLLTNEEPEPGAVPSGWTVRRLDR